MKCLDDDQNYHFCLSLLLAHSTVKIWKPSHDCLKEAKGSRKCGNQCTYWRITVVQGKRLLKSRLGSGQLSTRREVKHLSHNRISSTWWGQEPGSRHSECINSAGTDTNTQSLRRNKLCLNESHQQSIQGPMAHTTKDVKLGEISPSFCWHKKRKRIKALERQMLLKKKQSLPNNDS